MRKIQMVDLSTQYHNMKDEVDQALQAVIDSCGFINGGPVKEFAKDLASYLQVAHVTPCGNGTDALQIALMALDVQPGDEVITTPFTFVSTAEVIALLQLKPVFVDIQPDTYNIDPEAIEAAITTRTKAIIPVHLFGQAADMAPIMAIAQKHGIAVIEDNAQATGGRYTFPDGNEQMLGSIGDIGCTSFYPTKNLGGYGDGGALSTNSSSLANAIHLIANHGSDRKYYYDAIGVNSRLDTMQAAILQSKLKRLDTYNANRRKAADAYDAIFSDHDAITIPYRAPYAYHVFHQYTIRIAGGRDALQTYLGEHDIPSMVYYPVPLHISKAYAKYGYTSGDFPVAEEMATSVISLPMHSELDHEQIEYITSHVLAYANNKI